jgi:hypothetical protein
MSFEETRLLLNSTIPATAVEPAAMPGCSIAMITPSANKHGRLRFQYLIAKHTGGNAAMKHPNLISRHISEPSY